jgi:ankyrin repeat protein
MLSAHIIIECLRSLWFSELEARFYDIDDAAESTCQWLRIDPEFVKWERSKSGIFWIKGNPGSGKSTLMKFAFQNHPKEISSASFFFNRRGTMLEHTLKGCYRSLLHQLLPLAREQFARIIKTYIERSESGGKVGESWNWHESELKKLVSQVLLETANRPIRIYIDALDEAGEENAIQLIQQLHDLVNRAEKADLSLHIIFSCRYYPIIALDGFSVEVEKENASDIRFYVQQQFTDHKIPPTKAKALIPTIIDMANGIFQWVNQVLPRVLHDCRTGKSLEAIQRTIKRLPAELHDLYRVLLSEVTEYDRLQSLKLFRWVLFSQRPLTVREVRYAVAVDPDVEYSNWQQFSDQIEFSDSDKDMEQRVVDLSKGLLEVRRYDYRVHRYKYRVQRVVQIIHESVTDYLVSESGLQVLCGPYEVLSTGEHNARLAWSCVRFIVMTQSKLNTQISKPLKFYPLLQYAVQYWIVHASIAEENKNDPDDLFQLFIILHDFEWRLEQLISLNKGQWHPTFPHKTTIPHLLARTGQCRAMQLLLSRRIVDLNKRDAAGFTPCMWAVLNSQEEMVALLSARNDVDINLTKPRRNRSVLSMAILSNNTAIVEILTKRGDLDGASSDVNGRTPLFLAVSGASEEIVKLLLEWTKVDPNAKDIKGRTPLSLATMSGGYRKLRLLLDRAGVDVNTRCKDGRTPLAYAVKYGSYTSIQLLSSRQDVNVNLADSSGWSPLFYAVERRRHDIVKLLLARQDIKANLKDNSGRAAIHYTADVEIRSLLHAKIPHQ